jgi:hypothetical protein
MNEQSKLVLKTIQEMKDNGALDEDLYCKCLVELAYAFLKKGEFDDCVQTVGKCNPKYFGDKQLEHMIEDQVYREIVIYLAYKFVQLGVVELDGTAVPTQKNGGTA